MKYAILMGAGLLTLAGCNSDAEQGQENETTEIITDCHCDELGFDESYNNFYLEEPRDGYTGHCETQHPNGQTALSKDFAEGKVHGKVIEYYPNGNVKEEMEFDHNLQTGDHYKYTEDGRLDFHATYESGKQTEILVYPSAM